MKIRSSLYYINIVIILSLSVTLSLSCESANSNKPLPNSAVFITIFDGKTFNGWKADTSVWHIENGCFVGEVTPSKQIQTNSFLIYNKSQAGDFEFKAQFKISNGGNSGVNYRSEELADIPYALKGYQADIDGENVYTGQNYEERGRGFLAMRGQNAVINNSTDPFIIKSIGNSDSLKSKIIVDDWNEIHLIVKGNNMQHYINGILMSETTDNDASSSKLSGLIGLQVHVSKEMKVAYKNIQIKIEKP
ncbi:MAG: DUF1080 domain-containing protein [Chitinophagaceae bacterium]|nr:DUF1080 domain-containing protein [Chitinophagaceae bacterium]